MCGIIGYVGGRPCRELILTGLERLEYRGYDSAGFALMNDDQGVAEAVRAVGNLSKLRDAAGLNGTSTATAGLGHTRWATHGRVTTANAHPHTSSDGKVIVVMNGIIENYIELRTDLQNLGVVFNSDTDTEVIPQLLAREYMGDLATTVREVLPRLGGHFAFVAAHVDEPGRLVASRRECPLVIGVGEGERFVASAIPAFLRETREVVLIEDDEVVVLEAGGHTVFSGDVEVGERAAERVDWDEDAAEKGGYDTFMLKEIHEQPAALWDTIGDRLRPDGAVDLFGLGLDDAALARVERIHVVACGTSYHAGLVGRYLIEDWARIPVHVEVASEYRYRTCLAGPGDLVIGITQSGETADTLAAMRVARERGAHVVALTNIMGSQATRDADGVLYTRAGLEIGVAATKTHTAQVMALSLLALKLGRLKWALTAAGALDLAEELRRVPAVARGVPGLIGPRRGGARGREVRGPLVLPVPGPSRGRAGVLRGRAQAQGDQLHPDRGLPGRRDEARPDRAAGGGLAGRGGGHRRARLRQGRLQHPGGPRPRRPGDRRRDRGQRGDRAARRRRPVGAPHPGAAVADRGRHPAADLRVRPGPGARPERGPAAQPGQDRHRRVEVEG